jgi:pyruvyltransferase
LAIRTYYWSDRIVGKTCHRAMRALGIRPSYFFATGNAGDTFAKNLIQHVYSEEALCTKDQGKRLLCVGSIGHRIKPGDVLCGVGCKDIELSPVDPGTVTIYGLRGPLSLERFRAAGFNVNDVRFLKDPGLMIRFMLDAKSVAPVRGRVAFIPHYRERYEAARRLPDTMHFIDIDADPLDVGREILTCEIVLSSSLHGIVFAHALGRTAVLVRPGTREPLSKFEDYYLSVDLPFKPPLDSVDEFSGLIHDQSPPTLRYEREDFFFPPLSELKERGIAF